jgi:hypothetical protein
MEVKARWMHCMRQLGGVAVLSGLQCHGAEHRRGCLLLPDGTVVLEVARIIGLPDAGSSDVKIAAAGAWASCCWLWCVPGIATLLWRWVAPAPMMLVPVAWLPWGCN